MKQPYRYIRYHKNCNDGFGAALAAYYKFGLKRTSYIPINYNEPMDDYDGAVIYFVDFCPTKEQIFKLIEDGNKVTILDHHKTAKENLEGLVDTENLKIVFDMNKCGAVISWEFFNPGVELPPLFAFLQDRDLWLNKLEDTNAVYASLSSRPFHFKTWNDFMYMPPIEDGRRILTYQKMIINDAVKRSHTETIDGNEIPAVNSPILQSDICHALLEKFTDAEFVTCFTVMDGFTQHSLRSRGNVDVSAIAKKYGGGGHHNAAGMTIKH